MSDARTAVLSALRAARERAAYRRDGAAELAAPAAAPADAPPGAIAGKAPAAALRAAFARALAAAGGTLVEAPAGEPLAVTLAALPLYRASRRIASALPGLAAARESAAPPDPRAFDGLDLAVVPGAFGVAENGAVWVDAGALPERALLWLAEHLVLVVPADALVADLHEAYARLRFDGPGFGVFVAGPSKTADIEQALVIGAQGPRSTTVVLAGAAGAPAA